MNRIAVSIPRVLDSAVVVTQDAQLQIPVGNLPSTAVAPFTITKVKAVANETLMHDTNITPLAANTRCSRVTATVTIPLTLSITDANNLSFETHTTLDRFIDIVLYIPEEAAFPYDLTCEAAVGVQTAQADSTTASLNQVTTKILVRVTAITDLLIHAYGYAPINPAENYHANDSQNFLNQPLFPIGKVY